MKTKILAAAACLALVSVVSGCSVLSGALQESPVLPELPVADLLVPVDVLNDRFGGGWSEGDAGEISTEVSAFASPDKAEYIQAFGEECGSALFALYEAEDAASAAASQWSDSEGLATVVIQRFGSVAAATATFDALATSASECRTAALTNPAIPYRQVTTTFEGAEAVALGDSSSTATDFDRGVFIRNGDLLISASSRVSIERAEQLLQAQLDYIASLEAADG